MWPCRILVKPVRIETQRNRTKREPCTYIMICCRYTELEGVMKFRVISFESFVCILDIAFSCLRSTFRGRIVETGPQWAPHTDNFDTFDNFLCLKYMLRGYTFRYWFGEHLVWYWLVVPSASSHYLNRNLSQGTLIHPEVLYTLSACINSLRPRPPFCRR